VERDIVSRSAYRDWTYGELITEAKRCWAEFAERDADPVLGPMFIQFYELRRRYHEGEISEEELIEQVLRWEEQLKALQVEDPWRHETRETQTAIYQEVYRRGVVHRAAVDLNTIPHLIVLRAKLAESR
jgi:hypothetical protein